jgi:hypothetical protein
MDSSLDPKGTFVITARVRIRVRVRLKKSDKLVAAPRLPPEGSFAACSLQCSTVQVQYYAFAGPVPPNMQLADISSEAKPQNHKNRNSVEHKQ